MKPLFCITVVLSVLWAASAAPQLLSLNSSSVSELSDLVTTTVSEISSPNNAESASSVYPDTKEITTKESSPTLLESTTEIFNLREEHNNESNGKLEDETDLPSDSSDLLNDTNKSIFTANDSVDTVTNAGTASLKPTEDSETLNESEIPITRYVPPLDPIKHMLMMADIKGMGNFPHFLPKVNLKPETTTSDNPTSKELEINDSDILNKDSHNSEVITDSSENIEEIVTETSLAVSTENNNHVRYETTEQSSTEKIIEVEATENIVTNKSVDIISTTESLLSSTPERENFEESIERIIANESSEKVVSEPSEVFESEEKYEGETTIRDVTTMSSTVFNKLDGLSSYSSLDDETSSNYTSTLTPSTDETEEVTLGDIENTTELEEKSDAILKNSDSEINVKEVINDTDKKVTESEGEISSIIFSSTEDRTEVDNFTSSDNLLKSNDELKTDLPISISESTTNSTVHAENETEINTITSSITEENINLTFTATTEVPETTPVEFKYTSTSESESDKKNISLEDELEFRAVKFPQNASKVSYVEKDSVELDALTASEPSSEVVSENETSTASIFTTIAEILFSSSSTVNPTDIPEITETEDHSEDNPTEKLPLKEDSDSGVVLLNDPSDSLKIETVTPELDSIPAEDTTIATSSADSVSVELEPEELIKSESEKELDDDEKFLDRASGTDATTLQSVKSEATTEHFIPTAESSTISSTELEPEVIESLENQTQNLKDVSSESKPSDYMFYNKNRYVSGNNTDMVAAVQFLHYHDKASSEQCFKLVNAHWNYATNLTEENKIKQLEQTLQYSLYHKAAWKNATSFAWKTFNDTLLRRWFKSLSILGISALPENKLNEFNKLKAEMKNTYSTAKICTYIPPEDVKKGQILQEKDCNLTLEPDLQRILTKSRDYDELVHVWKSWRDAAGKPIREKYLRFVELGNEGARINGFSDIGDMWREAYESETFENDLEELWNQVRPLYEHLHAYVRRRLIQQYGSDKIKEDGPIPAHLFGNMWAQSWVSLLDITQPFPGKPSVDVTPIMQAKNMTPYEMFKISEEFFTSLGLKPMPETFWKHSLIEKPKDREIICHASAWDFCNGKDYRIKQCTDITMEDLITVHHEMGHIQYFLQYARQPAVFREGANPGFHEAIGDVMALSVSTPKHLQSIGLLDEVADDPEGDLNFLLYTALDKVSFLPTGYLIELWRWGLFSGEIKPEEMNTKWWELRLKYQGVCPPVKRTDTDFDPGAKFHIPGHVPYIRYFVSFVIQFQFHKVLCDAAGHTGPLYKCDIYRSKEAGQILSQVMELGSSEHWSEAMKIMTGGATNKMDAGPIMEYFEPLLDFLKEQNQNETIGWRSDDPTICP